MTGTVDDPQPLNTRGSKWQELFGIDLRTLALFRVMLGLMLIVDIIDRCRNFTEHYTDAGALPFDAIVAKRGGFVYSLHAYVSFSEWLTAALFGAHILVAIGLIIGVRTWWMTLAAWGLWASLHQRSSAILNAGDWQLLTLLFWSLFLPLGARCSIDAALNTNPRRASNGYLTIATVVMLLQTCIVYWTGVCNKMLLGHINGEPGHYWLDGQSLHYALQIDILATPIGVWLREIGWALPYLTYATLIWEAIGPFFAFSPVWTGPLRLLTVIGFMLMHLGFLLCLGIGIFGVFSMLAWVPFVPGWLWDSLAKCRYTPKRTAVRVYYDGDCGFCRKMVYILRAFFMLPTTPLHHAQDDPTIHAEMKAHNSWVVITHDGRHLYRFEALLHILRISFIGRPLGWLLSIPPLPLIGTAIYKVVANHRNAAGWVLAPLRWRPNRIALSWPGAIICAAAATYVLVWNIGMVDTGGKSTPSYLKPIEPIGKYLRLNQNWSMFAPAPTDIDGWYVITGTLHNGRRVSIRLDGTEGDAITFTKPAFVRAEISTIRDGILKFFLRRDERSPLWHSYADYLRRQWNAHHPSQEHLAELTITFVRETLPKPKWPQNQPWVWWEQVYDFADPAADRGFIQPTLTEYDPSDRPVR